MVTIMGTNVSACLENFNLHDFNSLIIILIANFSYYLKMLLSRKIMMLTIIEIYKALRSLKYFELWFTT